MFRIGQGIDAHAFCSGDHVMLGGVRIPHDRGLAAHSDGDVVLHALCDALLGAVADGDIGRHFPNSDPTWKEADSRGLLRSVMARVHAAGYRVENADATVLAQTPKLAPWIPAMRDCIAADLQVPATAVSVKATTTERMGFTGREEGIVASVVVLLRAADGH